MAGILCLSDGGESTQVHGREGERPRKGVESRRKRKCGAILMYSSDLVTFPRSPGLHRLENRFQRAEEPLEPPRGSGRLVFDLVDGAFTPQNLPYPGRPTGPGFLLHERGALVKGAGSLQTKASQSLSSLNVQLSVRMGAEHLQWSWLCGASHSARIPSQYAPP